MIDLATVTSATFEAHKGSRFVMRADRETAFEVELVAIEPLPTRPGAPRTSFLLRFRAPDKRHFPQQIYALEHPVLGGVELFLVPSKPDAVGTHYDAVIS